MLGRYSTVSAGVAVVGMQAFMRSCRCWFSDIASEGTISKVCPFKLAARNLSLVKHMEYLETYREEAEVDIILAKLIKVICIIKTILELNLHLKMGPNTEHH